MGFRFRPPGLLHAVFCIATTVAPAGAFAQPLTLDDVVDPSRLVGEQPSHLVWSPNGQWLVYLVYDAQAKSQALWIVDREGRSRRRLFKPRDQPEGDPIKEVVWAPDGQALVVLRRELWWVGWRDATQTQLTSDGGDKRAVTVAPNGRSIAYVRDGDLWVIRTKKGRKPRRLTRIARAGPAAKGVYARRDREIGPATWGRSFAVAQWSPDSRNIAVHIVDRRKVRQVPFPVFLGPDTTTPRLRRPYPGDRNEDRRVAFVNVRTGRLSYVPLPRTARMEVVNLEWSPTGRLLIDRMADDATVRELRTVRPGAKPRTEWRHARESRIYTPAASTWAGDGRRILVTGDFDDRDRIYALTPGSPDPVPLTPAEVDVWGPAMPLKLPGDTETILYVAGAPKPSERHVWQLKSGRAPVQLTKRAGTHRPVLSPDGQSLALLCSDDASPPELWMIQLDEGTEQRVTTAKTPRLERAGLIAPRYIQFPGPRGELHAKVWLPPAASKGAKVPVLFGPIYVNTVRNRWDPRFGLLQQYLVQQGYAVMQVDVRGSTGYGRDFREAFLFEWGRGDLDDLQAAKTWLQTQRWADPERVGVFGKSYGGLVSVYSMVTRPELFKVAVAMAPAVDARFFGSDDVAITRRPSTHPDAFERPAKKFADRLEGRLLIIHGIADDVVPFKTIVDLADAFIRADRDFDLVAIPGATHNLHADPDQLRHVYRKLVDYFDLHLPTKSPSSP